MFFSRKPVTPAKPVARASSLTPAVSSVIPSSTSTGSDASVVLDALGSVLQAYARFALDTESIDAKASMAKVTE